MTSVMKKAVRSFFVGPVSWLVRCASGARTLAAGLAALHLDVGQAATAKQAESLTETQRQSVETSCSCVGDRDTELPAALRGDWCIFTE